jgi:hypothetical protein
MKDASNALHYVAKLGYSHKDLILSELLWSLRILIAWGISIS